MYFHFPTFRYETKDIKKVVVFDLDETIGSFSDLIGLLKYIKKQKQIKISQKRFNELLDLYPEFLQNNIIEIFIYLMEKKRSGECYQIYIYTNNIYSPEFPKYIQNYFDYKYQYYLNGFSVSRKVNPLNVKVIDHLICAFKVNNIIINFARTTNEKTYDDFMKCSLLPKSTIICFVDNKFHKKMQHKNVNYIYIKSYFHRLSKMEIWERFFIYYFKNFSNLPSPSRSTFPSRNTENFTFLVKASPESNRMFSKQSVEKINKIYVKNVICVYYSPSNLYKKIKIYYLKLLNKNLNLQSQIQFFFENTT